ncbi:hypothetical protein ACW180_00815 [Limosilactobacillus fermentum]
MPLYQLRQQSHLKQDNLVNKVSRASNGPGHPHLAEQVVEGQLANSYQTLLKAAAELLKAS